jgi:hypothetical protein
MFRRILNHARLKRAVLRGHCRGCNGRGWRLSSAEGDCLRRQIELYACQEGPWPFGGEVADFVDQSVILFSSKGTSKVKHFGPLAKQRAIPAGHGKKVITSSIIELCYSHSR